MKKTLYFLLCIFMAVILSSCNITQKTPNPDTGASQTPSETTYLVPFFATDKVQTSRGLTEMPSGGIWGDDSMRAPSVMQALPAMIGLSASEATDFNDVIQQAESNKTINLYGFEARAETTHWKENSDGYYMRYTICSNGSDIGFIEFYFDRSRNIFSYRQLVLITFIVDTNSMLGKRVGEAFLLCLEYDDIPITETSERNFSFSFGQLNNGEIETNAFKDDFSISKLSSKGDYIDKYSFTRSYLSGNSNYENYYAFFHPDLEEATYYFDYTEVKNKISQFFDNTSSGVIKTEEEAKKANLDFVYDILPLIYTNANSLEKAGPYASYDDFTSKGFKNLNDVFDSHWLKNDNQIKEGERPYAETNPVIFSWEGGNSAAAQTEKGNGMSFTSVTKENWANTDFGKYYKNINPENLSEDELVTTLIKAHLTACGIKDENYIENFTFAEKYERNGLPYWPYKITTESPETFKEHFKDAVEKLNLAV